MKVVTTNLLNRFWKNGVKPIKDALTGKVDSSRIVNSLLATEAGFALDARQGKVLNDKVTELNGKLTFVNADQTSLINTYNRIAMYQGFQLWKVGTNAYLQIAFHNNIAMLADYVLVQVPEAFKPAATISLFDADNNTKYVLDTSGIIRAAKSIPVNTVTRIIACYQCVQ